jgi:hypothetical protein
MKRSSSLVLVLGGATFGAILAAMFFFGMSRDDNTVSVHFVQTVQSSNNF